MHPRAPITVVTSPSGVTSPALQNGVLPRTRPVPPVQYRIEERRRTVYVTSTVPPEQWNTETVNDIFKLADIPEGEQGDARSPSLRRANSLIEREALAFEEDTNPMGLDEQHNGSPPVYRQGHHRSRSEVTLGIPNTSNTPPPTTPIRNRGSPRTPRSPLRQRILFYHKHDPHYGFTNFSSHPVMYNGKRYPTSEHLFQSFKFQGHRPNLAEHIRTCSERPSVAFSEARRFQPEVRFDWKQVNIQKMDETLWYKFTQHADLKAELLATGDAELVEDSDKDSFWGVGADHRGRNELGKALERLRASFREA